MKESQKFLQSVSSRNQNVTEKQDRYGWIVRQMKNPGVTKCLYLIINVDIAHEGFFQHIGK